MSNAFYLILNTAVGALLGAAFWLIAARLYPDSDVGFAAAVISVSSFLGAAGTLGLPTALVRFLPEAAKDPRRSRDLVNASMTLSGIAGAGLAVVFLFGLDTWAPSLLFLRQDFRFSASFVLFCVLLTLAPILDAIAVSFRKARFVLGRGVLYSGVRTPLPLALATLGIFGLFFSFLVGLVLSTFVAALLFVPRLIVRLRPMPTTRFDSLRPLFGFVLGNHTAALLSGLGPALLPLLVVQLRSSRESAWFYVAWLLGTMIYVIPGAFATSLYAEGSQVDHDLQKDVRRSLLGATIVAAPAGVFLFAWGDRLLGLFGAQYVTGAFGLLRLLVLATPFVISNGVYLTLVRVEKRVAPLIASAAFSSTFVIGASWISLPTGGLEGVGITWLLGQALITVAISPSFVRRLVGKRLGR